MKTTVAITDGVPAGNASRLPIRAQRRVPVVGSSTSARAARMVAWGCKRLVSQGDRCVSCVSAGVAPKIDFTERGFLFPTLTTTGAGR